MFGPKYPSYDSLGPSLGLSWAHVRPMPMLASVRTMLTHVASRSGLGQERGRGCSCACLCSASCLLLRLRRVHLLLRVLVLVLCSCSSSSSFFLLLLLLLLLCLLRLLLLLLRASSSSSSSCRAWSCSCSSHMFGPKYPSYDFLGPIGLSWPMLGLCWPMLALAWPCVGLSWPHVGPILAPCWPRSFLSRLAYVGPMLAHVGCMLAHLGAYVGASLGVLWPSMLKHLQVANLFFPLPGAQNHVKTTVFEQRQDKIRGRRGARNTVHDVFERRAQNTPLTGSSVGSGVFGGCSGEVGGRGVSAYNLRLPTEGLPARTSSAAGPAPRIRLLLLLLLLLLLGLVLVLLLLHVRAFFFFFVSSWSCA